MKCPNINDPIYKALTEKYNEDIAYKVWEENNFDMPLNMEEAEKIVIQISEKNEMTVSSIKKKLLDVLSIQKATYKNKPNSRRYIESIDEVISELQTGDDIAALINMIGIANHFTQQAKVRLNSVESHFNKGTVDNMSSDELEEIAEAMNEIKTFLSAFTILEDIESIHGLKIEDASNLNKAIQRRREIVKKYKNLHEEVIAQWLNSQVQRVNNNLKAAGVEEANLLDKGKIKNLLNTATSNVGMMERWLGATASSNDPLVGLITARIKEEADLKRREDIEIFDKLMNLHSQKSGNKNNPSEFNSEYIEEVMNYEWIPELNKDGTQVYNKDGKKVGSYQYIKRKAFVSEYKYDKFDADYRNFKDSLKAYKDNDKIKRITEWLKLNTKLISNPKQLIEQKKSKLEPTEFKRWIAENTKQIKIKTYEDGSTSLDYLDAKSIHEVKNGYVYLYDGDFILPDDRYKNPKFKSLQADTYYMNLYQTYKKSNDRLPKEVRLKYGILPQIRQGGYEKYVNGNGNGFWNNVRDDYQHSVNVEAYDVSYGLQRPDGKDLKYVPVYYTSLVDSNELSTDLLQTTLLFSQMANNHYRMSNLEPFVRMVTDALEGNNVVDIDARQVSVLDANGKPKINPITGQPLKNRKDNGTEALVEFMDKVVYGEKEIPSIFTIADKEYSMNKIANNVIKYTSLNGLAWNINSFFNNTIIGNYSLAVEAIAGKYFSKGNLLSAETTYWSELNGVVEDAMRGFPKSKLGRLLRQYDGIQGSFENEYGHNVSGSAVKRAFSGNLLMVLTHGAEHQIQSTGMIALMKGQKVKKTNGTEINLWEAYDSEGNLKKDVIWSKDDEFNFMQKIHKLNKELHGVHNSFDSPSAQRRWFGKLALLFRKHIYTGFKRRWGSEYLDIEEGAYNKGYYNQFFTTLWKALKDGKYDMMFKASTPAEKQARAKSLTEITTMLIIFAITGIVGNDDDKENSWMEDWIADQMLLQGRRLSGDIGLYLPVNPFDVYMNLKSPTVAYTTIENLSKFLQQLQNPFEQYEKDSGIYEKGDYKLEKRIKELIPVLSKIDNALTPGESLKFYNQGK